MTITQSELFPNNVSRAEAARIVHDYLLHTLREKDEEDISAAFRLKDLYDCHVCVGHIAQAFVKGIIAPQGPDRFGLNDILKPQETQLIYIRLTDRTKRLKVEGAGKEVVCVTGEDLKKLSKAVIIDVRSKDSFEAGHMADAINIPLEKLSINPLLASQNLAVNLAFVCDKGVKAQFAAHLAVKAGYTHVFYTSCENAGDQA